MKTIVEPNQNPVETVAAVNALYSPLLGMETKTRQRYVMMPATDEQSTHVCWHRVGGGLAFDSAKDITSLVTQALRSQGVLKVVRFESMIEMADWINGH